MKHNETNANFIFRKLINYCRIKIKETSANERALARNFGIDNIKNSHPIFIYINFRYWWRTDNKDSSTRYVSSETKCSACIRIKQNKILKQNEEHYHDSLTDSENFTNFTRSPKMSLLLVREVIIRWYI
ncbi:hypothetical protein BpHYR1_032392 [Brachionus plicatilis]|uniref:FLYWCH-type domain-containing protein n=1 Tax=Brachionus plicatilis TaxID=10195 RepID=A0A3M7PKU9_BRAPC|nr:hypothetical protein BpHYR1_032392 [Brachionus plicatilis]